MAELADTTLVLANPAQWRAAQENQFPTWFAPRGYKDVDDFIEWRKPFFDNDARWNSKDGKRTQLTWSLVPRGSTDTADILCGCETYLRPGIYLPPGATEPVDCVSYGIACVYTNPVHRGKGYARHMLRLLHYLVAPTSSHPPFPGAWGAPPAVPQGLGLQDAAFSVLYSGVGDQFYAKCTKGEHEPGWVCENAPLRQWNLREDDLASAEEEDGWTWLSKEDLREWEVEAARRIRRDITTHGARSKTRMAVLPDPYVPKGVKLISSGCFEVHATRYQVIPGFRPDATFGLVLPEKDGERPFFTYSCQAFDDEDRDSAARMVIMYATSTVPWSAVVAAARKEGVRQVEMWGGEWYAWWDAEAGGVNLQRGHRKSCIAQYGFGGDDKIQWEFDEKFAWM